MPRIAIYARYSSDLQRAASIDDQVRLCRERARDFGAGDDDILIYTDAAISGASMKNRPGINALMADAKAGKFEILIAEALDRLSRDQEDIAGLYKRLTHYGVRIVTLAEGDNVSKLHVGLKGTMNALFLEDLAAKVKRGLRGRVEAGYFAANNAYGYDIVREIDARGELVRGKRKINEAQAAVIRRVFKEYVSGRTTRQIAAGLNRDGIPSPSGGAWNYAVILGCRRRQNGILSNPLYIGKLVFNRQSFAKDPDTGRRVGRINPRDKWVTVAVPHLRIVPQELWDEAQAIRERRGHGPFHAQRGPRRLLSGLIRCGVCGGPAGILMTDYVGCAAHHRKRTCTNHRLIRMEILERRVLDGLREKLVAPALFEEFAKAYRAERQRRREELLRGRAGLEAELAEVQRKIGRLVAAIENGADTPEVAQRLRELSDRRDALQAELAAAERPNVVDIHPHLGEAYRRLVGQLQTTLAGNAAGHQEARAIIRSMIEKIVLHPGEKRGRIRIELHGQIQQILDLLTDPAADGTTVKSAAVRRYSLHSNFAPLVVSV